MNSSSEHSRALADIELTVCTPVHGDVLAGLHQSCFDQCWRAPAFQELLAMPGGFGFIALVKGEPAGFIVARQAHDEGEIITLGVVPARRRHGLARVLIGQAESRVSHAGGQTMFLEVAANNQAAQTLYESLGYAEAGRRPGYYKTNDGAIDAMILKKIFGGPGPAF
ncbi:MAG: GNAT family N-acetyltransferase [Rhodospirillales bacterium]|jgi:ribosomal-protein-alanine N-acetyltransferase